MAASVALPNQLASWLEAVNGSFSALNPSEIWLVETTGLLTPYRLP